MDLERDRASATTAPTATWRCRRSRPSAGDIRSGPSIRRCGAARTTRPTDRKCQWTRLEVAGGHPRARVRADRPDQAAAPGDPAGSERAPSGRCRRHELRGTPRDRHRRRQRHRPGGRPAPAARRRTGHRRGHQRPRPRAGPRRRRRGPGRGPGRPRPAGLGDRLRARQDPPHFLVNAAAILEVIPLARRGRRPRSAGTSRSTSKPSGSCAATSAGSMVEGGAIVNFSSPSARWAYTLETAVYGATKTAIQGVTRSFAIALAPRKIRVNAISPGITDTPMQEKVLREVSALRGLTYEELSSDRARSSCRSADPPRRRRWPASSSGSCRTRPRTSPARRSTSTAATSCRPRGLATGSDGAGAPT